MGRSRGIGHFHGSQNQIPYPWIANETVLVTIMTNSLHQGPGASSSVKMYQYLGLAPK